MDQDKQGVTAEEWSLKITKVDNGYLLESSSIRVVFEDDERDTLKSSEHLLWEIMEYFNFQGSKHDIERLYIVRKKQ